MSADCITWCPARYARVHNKAIADVTVDDLNDESIPNELREYYEFYINCGTVVVEYASKCRECGYQVSFTYEHPLP